MKRRESLKPDTRLIGDTAESILACLLRNKDEIICQRFNIEGFDLIAFDAKNKIFKGGSPFFIQVKTRGGWNPTGMDSQLKTVENAIKKLEVDESSVYIAVGFYGEDIREIEFYLIPWAAKDKLYTESGNIRFNKKRLDPLVENGSIKKIEKIPT